MEIIINPWKMFHGAWVPNWLMERSEVTQGAKLAYGRLCEFAGKHGRAFPTVTTLAECLAVNKRQCQRYLSELESHNLIKREGNESKPNSYYFLAHPWMELPGGGDIKDTGEGDIKVTTPMSYESQNGESYPLYEKTQYKRLSSRSRESKVKTCKIPELMGLTPEREAAMRAVGCTNPKEVFDHFYAHYANRPHYRVKDWDAELIIWTKSNRTPKQHMAAGAAVPLPKYYDRETFLKEQE